jgi:hypothetical protein
MSAASPRRGFRSHDLLVASIKAVVVAVVGGVVAWLGKGRFDALDRKIDCLETRLEGRIDTLQSRVDGRFDTLQSHLEGRFDTLQSHLEGRFDTLQSSMDAMRSDLTQVALAVGVRPRAQND